MARLLVGNIKGAQGAQGPTGPQGPQGVQGPTGPGVPTGGSAGQYLIKQSATDYDADWGAITTDSAPTSGGTNPITSGGVYSEAGKLAAGMAILANGNTHAAIASGQFVYVRGHGTLADGTYKATANIAANGALSISNLTAAPSGGLNALNADIDSLSSNFAWKALTFTTGSETMTLPDADTAKEFIFVAQYGTSSGMQSLSFTFSIPNVTAINNLAPTQGYYLTNGNAFCQIGVNCVSHVASLAVLMINDTNYTATSRLYCFYR